MTSGALEGEIFYDTSSGTPQGGPISPTLANIVLSGLEKEIKSQCGNRIKENKRVIYRKVNVVRYADDFVVTCRDEQSSEEIIKVIDNFLIKRGLQLNKKKTKVTKVTDGFDFLGFNFRA